ncbi:hypothetical protein [Bradyrhizobium sp. WSM3983]|uniref:hypothetical protein n=1 Tax=Bradyrhizobium sp. WSM3983 TaxID=1038867 RepID=UPI000421591D|nr:hypothetical protein [Bradyrhizobium sp. WSM3983]
MPEFVLDQGSPEAARAFQGLDAFTQGYIECLFFTDEERLCEEGKRDMPAVVINRATMESRFEGGDSFGFADLAPVALASIVADCQRFQAVNRALLDQAAELVPGSTELRYAREALDDRRLGQLFWYARNGHGVAFTDDGNAACLKALQEACGWRTPFQQTDSYVGDDGLVYLA